ncbi:DUF6712 family protein [Flavobacterium sp. 25HG05S-40]|uniref:DUF6712 family protein n=1 Tax=Flavobacterium sp. 25HG05S-40 TaxID=3458682 RepID=UPI004044C00E
MALNLLINKAKVSELLQIAIGVPEAEFEKYIEEAQKLDLKKLMCDEFYYDLLKNKGQANFVALINGGDYEYENKSYSHDGLSRVLAYFTYARFQLNSPVVSTSHGMVIKSTPHSEAVSLEERRSTYYKKREDASEFMTEVVKFIERNIEDYPTWNCETSCSGKRSGSFSTRVLR